jgi:hypothetical protein
MQEKEHIQRQQNEALQFNMGAIININPEQIGDTPGFSRMQSRI